MTGLNSKEQTIIDLLTATNTKLDSVLEALGAPIPTATVTLADIKDVLDAIRSAVAPIGETLPSGAKTSIAWSTYRLMDAVAPPWPRPTSVPVQPAIELLRAYLVDTVGERLPDSIFTLWNMQQEMLTAVGDILNHIGEPTGDATTTVLGRLAEIERASVQTANGVGLVPGDATTTVLGQLAAIERCTCGPILPGSGDPNGCTNPILSDVGSSIASSDYGNRVFATWTPPETAEIAYFSFLEHPVTFAEIQRADAGDGWKAFVYSTRSPSFSINPENPLLLTTNQWFSIDHYLNMAFSVDPGSDIQVLICPPSSGPITSDCFTLDSVAATYSSSSPFSRELQAIQFTSVPSLELSNTWFAVSLQQTIDMPDTVILTNMKGWSVRLVTGTDVNFGWADTSGGQDRITLASPDDSGVFPVDTTAAFILNFDANAPAVNPFTIELCPPQPA